jgi:flagellar assembly protein FliH
VEKNTSKIIVDEATGSYQRWRLPDVATNIKGSADGRAKGNGLMTASHLEAIQKQAYEEGFERGRRDGLLAGEGAVRDRAQRLERLFHTLARPLTEVDQQVVEELMTTVLVVAKHMIRREIKADAGQVIAVIHKALAELPSASRNIKIFLHPEDVPVVRDALAGEEERDVPWKLCEDPLISPGGCRIRTEHSEVDATMETRLARIAAELLGGERESELL